MPLYSFRALFLYLCVFVCTCCQPAYAQNNVGLSYLGACNKTWPCDASIKGFDTAPVMRFGWLATTFGEECSCVTKLLQSPKPKEVRVQLVNSTCFRERGRVCGSYEPFYNMTIPEANAAVLRNDPIVMRKINKSIRRTSQLLSDARSLRGCWVSPCLECNLNKAARSVLLERAKNAFPSCQIVDNPLDDSCIAGYVCEKHGPDSPANRPLCGADLDGDDFQRVDLPSYGQRYKRCEYNHIWGLKFNCIEEGKPFIDPRERNCRGANQYYFTNAGRYLSRDALTLPPLKPVNPRDIRDCRVRYVPHDGPGGFTLKQSDSNPGAVVLLPKGLGIRTLKLIRDRKVVSTCNYKADFHGDGRPIYRCDKDQVGFPTNAVMKADNGACWVLDYPNFRID